MGVKRFSLVLIIVVLVSNLFAKGDSTARATVDTISRPLYNAFTERYILDEVKRIRENQIELKTELRDEFAKTKIQNTDQAVSYATSTVNNLFYIIAAATSIFVIVGWSSLRDIKNKIAELVDEKVNAITLDYEERLNALDKRLKARSEEIIEAHEKIAKANTIHALWMRSGLEITPQAKIDIYDEILKIRSDDVEALSYKADSLLELHEPQWALSLCNKALGIDGEYAFAYWQRACAQATLCNYDMAIDDIRKALILSPDLQDELKTEKAFDPLRSREDFMTFYPTSGVGK